MKEFTCGLCGVTYKTRSKITSPPKGVMLVCDECKKRIDKLLGQDS